MARLYGLLSQASGSLAVALLAIVLAAAASNTAFADVAPGPCACQPEETQEECDARCGFVSCGGGNPDCAVYVAEGDCYPGGATQNNCNGNANCNCRWRPVNNVYKCVCQNTTGN